MKSVSDCNSIEMVGLRSFLSAVAFVCTVAIVADGNFVTVHSDFQDYDLNCVVRHLNNHHRFNLVVKPIKKRLGYCGAYMGKLESSFYEKAEQFIPQNTNRTCVINLLKRHNVTDVFIKAIAYNQYKKKLVKYKSNETCKGIVNILRVNGDYEYREMSVNFVGSNESLWRLRPCLNDLFGKFEVNEIHFVNQNESIGLRRFAAHLQSFLFELVSAAKNFCSDISFDLSAKYFGIEREKFGKIYNRTQLECFEKFFLESKILGNFTFEPKDSDQLNDDSYETSETCDEIMEEQVRKVVIIELFGFTELSQRVIDCILGRNAEDKLIEQVVILPAVMRAYQMQTVDDYETPRKVYIESTKKIIEMSLSCLNFF